MKIMKLKLIIAAMLSCGTMLLPSCKGCSGNTKTDGKAEAVAGATVHIADSLGVVNDAGDIVTETFVGLLPAADGPGINYEVSLTHYEKLNNGVFEMVTTYIDAEGRGEDRTFRTYGRYATMIGTGDNDTELYVRMVPFDGGENYNFVIDPGNNALTMLGNDLKRAKDSNQNYTLVKRNKVK